MVALRARLVAPAPVAREVWPHHTLAHMSVRASLLFAGDRRMEAENYLSSGFALKAAIESKVGGWTRLSQVARIWQPNRLKGIQVAREHGTPFLAATQIFDIRPIPRKWLALEKTEDAASRFVAPGTILVTRSGSVGRPALAWAPHEQTIISDDLLRVEPKQRRDWGWIYSFLHARHTRAMTKGAQYGHIIKHLEVAHLEDIPIPVINDDVADAYKRKVTDILSLRNKSYQLTLEAERLFEEALGPLKIVDWGERGFAVRAAVIETSNRVRFDATVHNPGVRAIRDHLAKNGQGFTQFSEAGYDVWVPGRYKRIPATNGVVYRDSADLLEVLPDLAKTFADCSFGDKFGGRVREGWILIPCSGQVYGIIGTATFATNALEDQVVSNHVLRAAPKAGCIPPGYVLTALSHPFLGRPLVKSLAFGSSVPEIDPDDLAAELIVRLQPSQENAIAELALASARARAKADILEREITQSAEELLDHFIS